MTPLSISRLTKLTPQQIDTLKAQGCYAENWDTIRINPDSDLSLLRNIEFEGKVDIGLLDRAKYPRCVISNALLRDTSVGDGARIRNVSGGLIGLNIANRVTIENTYIIENEKGAACGIGTKVAVLDETGSREVIIYPGMSAQEAMIMARARRSESKKIYQRTLDYINGLLDIKQLFRIDIGADSSILNCGTLRNINIGNNIVIEGARMLVNGSVLSSAPDAESTITRVGSGVDACNFIIEDGVADSGALLRNCYVGQGAVIEKGFTAHDSLFFANCSMENGEACALFAGPYTVSMHKGTLLIGCQTSFMNAGSSTNQSNHMYKLGPVHWGILERGVKTSSGSYLMLGANIGAFSLLMGNHKTHPDSREFPFSYLFGDPQGATVVVPAVMLRSCGLMRDGQKWPNRDRRKSLTADKILDRITFPILNPVTVDSMIEALEVIRPMLSRPADDDRYHRYKGMKLSRASLDRAMKLYYIGILKYLAQVFFPDYAEIGFNDDSLHNWHFPTPPEDEAEADRDSEKWVDLAGQIIRHHTLLDAIEGDSVEDVKGILNEALYNYDTEEKRWIAARFPSHLRLSSSEILRGAREYDKLVETDRATYRDSLSAEIAMLRLC